MSRINTNVSSLIAQNILGRSNQALEQSLERLSTGLRINRGKDDPAGLIASENLRSDIVSVRSAITNSERANQIIATADSALSEVSALLNDIRGLVTQAANTGALSDDQIAANQLQVDASLNALNRIAQTTEFQGRRLLDGSLGFIVTEGSGFSSVQDLQIHQANLGTTGSQAVNVQISSAASQATLTNNTGFSAATAANATLQFAAETNLSGFMDGSTNIDIQATSTDPQYQGVEVVFLADNAVAVGSEIATYDSNHNTLTIKISGTSATTANNVANAVNTQVGEFTAINRGPSDSLIIGSLGSDLAVAGMTQSDELLIVAAPGHEGSDLNNVQVELTAVAGSPLSAEYIAAEKRLVITVDSVTNTSLQSIETVIDSTVAEFNATTSTGLGDDLVRVHGNTADLMTTASTGTSGGETLLGAIDLQISGVNGTDTFSFGTNNTIDDLVAAVNLTQDTTGVVAAKSAGSLMLTSLDYGSKAFVDVNVVSEEASGTFKSGYGGSTRNSGTDISATVNGVAARADGNQFAINTATLDADFAVDEGSSQSFDFTITGGGAVFQLGPEVVSNQQLRVGLGSVNAVGLGGVSGKLFDLFDGGSADLSTDPAAAANIVEEAMNQITAFRGRLGALQKTTIDTNIRTLNDMLVNLTDAESAIRDVDFAAETAALTRAQILVQSGTSVLAIANSNPQNVLALLR